MTSYYCCDLFFFFLLFNFFQQGAPPSFQTLDPPLILIVLCRLKGNLFQIYALLLTAVANTLSQSDVVDGAVWTRALKTGMEAVMR